MEMYAPSPLATKALRDKYARKPLEEPEDVGPRRRSGRTATHLSPKPLTSSPADPDVDLPDETPGVSMINGRIGHSAAMSAPQQRSKLSSRRSRSGRDISQSSSQSSLSEGAFDNEDEDEEQPAATRSGNRSNRSNNSYSTPVSKTSRANASAATKRKLNLTDEGESTAENQSGLLTALQVALVLSVLVILGSLWKKELTHMLVKEDSQSCQRDFNVAVEEFHEQFMALRQDFPAQERTDWIVLRASLKSILQEEPRQPSVLVLVSDKAAEASAQCLATKIGCLINRVLGKDGASCVGMNAANFGHSAGSGTNDLFLAMERQLSGNASSVTLLGLEHLPGKVAMALHAFCDNDNAPFKHAAVVMTVTSDAGLRSDEDSELVADRVLRSAWKGELDEDRLSPLLSRVVVSAVSVKREQNVAC